MWSPRTLLLTLLPILAPPVCADVELPKLFGDGMVLQRDKPIRVWGQASPGEPVRVTIAHLSGKTVADSRGAWRIELASLPGGSGPHMLQVGGNNSITLWNVAIGEVWLGSGQEQLVRPVRDCPDADRITAFAGAPDVRIFREDGRPHPDPEWRGRGSWHLCNPKTVPNASATLYSFACELNRELGVPVGILHVAMTGTPIQSWTSARASLDNEQLRPFALLEDNAFRSIDLDAYEAFISQLLGPLDPREDDFDPNVKPRAPRDQIEYLMRQGGLGGLFNGKITPLIGYPLRGFIWYQGEENLYQAPLYYEQLPTLIADWRSHWGLGQLPFVSVQPASGPTTRPSADYATLRDAMRRSLELPRTGMVVTLDLETEANGLVADQVAVGQRIANWALVDVYEREGLASGPLFKSLRSHNETLEISFDHAPGGLRFGDPAADHQGFEIAGSNNIWIPAVATIDGDRLMLRAPGIRRPIKARYAWSNQPEATLFNRAGLPASPFTSDRPEQWDRNQVEVRNYHWNVSARRTTRSD